MNSLRATLRNILRFLRYPLCKHSEAPTKTEGTRAYTECLRCGYQSKGVVIAGHDYASTKHQWEPALQVPSRAEVAAIFGVPLQPAAPVLGNLAGHATSAHRKSAEVIHVNQDCKEVSPSPLLFTQAIGRVKRKPALKPRKISVKSVHKTSRKPSSKRSTTA